MPRRIECPHGIKSKRLCEICVREYHYHYSRLETTRVKNRVIANNAYAINPDKQLVRVSNRRAKNLGLDGEISLDYWLSIKTRCYYCDISQIKLTIEHVIPLAKGGTHSEDNIVAACIYCNRAKNSDDEADYRRWLNYQKTNQY